MDNQQHRAQNRSNSMPPLFALNNSVPAEDCKRIVENKGRRFEREAFVLPLVDPVLFIVPLEPHRYTKCITRLDLRRDRLGPNTAAPAAKIASATLIL